MGVFRIIFCFNFWVWVFLKLKKKLLGLGKTASFWPWGARKSRRGNGTGLKSKWKPWTPSAPSVGNSLEFPACLKVTRSTRRLPLSLFIFQTICIFYLLFLYYYLSHLLFLFVNLKFKSITRQQQQLLWIINRVSYYRAAHNSTTPLTHLLLLF